MSQGAGHWAKDNSEALGKWEVTDRGSCKGRARADPAWGQWLLRTPGLPLLLCRGQETAARGAFSPCSHSPRSPLPWPVVLESVVGTWLSGSHSVDQGAPSPLSSAGVCRAPAVGKPCSGPSGHGGSFSCLPRCACVHVCARLLHGGAREKCIANNYRIRRLLRLLFSHTCWRPSSVPKRPLAPTSLW